MKIDPISGQPKFFAQDLCPRCACDPIQRLQYRQGCPLVDELVSKICPWYDHPRNA